MIPNLTIIVASYVIVRLIALVLRQFPLAERHIAARLLVVTLSVVALVLVTLCVLDTLGVGLGMGRSIDARHGSPIP
jgi:hypothetical protein